MIYRRCNTPQISHPNSKTGSFGPMPIIKKKIYIYLLRFCQQEPFTNSNFHQLFLFSCQKFEKATPGKCLQSAPTPSPHRVPLHVLTPSSRSRSHTPLLPRSRQRKRQRKKPQSPKAANYRCRPQQTLLPCQQRLPCYHQQLRCHHPLRRLHQPPHLQLRLLPRSSLRCP